MSGVIVVGSQWGDEGKGKIVDFFAEHADAVVRYQGGNNAGHTIWHGNTKFELSALPSGILTEGQLAVIGNGVVVNPEALLAEIAEVQSQGIAIDNLRIVRMLSCLITLRLIKLQNHQQIIVLVQLKKELVRLIQIKFHVVVFVWQT